MGGLAACAQHVYFKWEQARQVMGLEKEGKQLLAKPNKKRKREKREWEREGRWATAAGPVIPFFFSLFSHLM